jgi:hypothetical protein
MALLGAAAFGVAAIYRAASHTEYFMVKTITVNDLGRLDSERVRKIVTPLLSGNIFTRDIDSATRLLEQYPQVESASVRLKLPDIAEVTVVERTPAATVLINGRPFLVDAAHRIIEEVRGQPTGLLIKGVGGGKPGDRIADPRLDDAFAIAELFTLDTVRHDKPVLIDMGNPERMEVHTSAGLFLRFGPDRRGWREKFYEYLTVRGIAADMGERMSGYDLSFNKQIVGIKDNNQPFQGGNK